MTKQQQVQNAVETAFAKHSKRIGSHWENEEAVTYNDVEDFAHDIIAAIFPDWTRECLTEEIAALESNPRTHPAFKRLRIDYLKALLDKHNTIHPPYS